MDPLSVTASVIALVQGTSAVTKGFKAVVDLRKAPEEYQELVGEIAWLQAYLGRLHSNFERAECAQQFNETDLSPLNSALRRVERTVSDLQSATNIVQKDSKGVENSRRVSKLKWQIHSSKITQLRDQVQQRRKDLHDAIGLLHFQNGSACFQSSLYLSFDSHEVQYLHSSSIQNQILLRASVASTRPSSPDLQDGNIDEQEILSDTNEQASEYSIDSLFSRRCPKICRCKCHHRPDWHAPSWLSRKLHESMSYLLGMHYWKMSLCDDPVCRDVSQQRVTMLCQIPFYHRALSIRLMWNSTSSHEASIHLRVPRLVDSTSYTWHAIRYGSLRSLQLLLDTKKAYPNDTREDGLNLLLVSGPQSGNVEQAEYLSLQWHWGEQT
ncbi:hypothetical protein F5Y16DRAFT_20184 [Xylariaceae sp. FL0255]|nr:hypothetical protein F5Y16DRAFT_20184 [Xylariaceae sp. FL0255]